MNRRTRTLIVLAIAIVCATAASLGVWLTIRRMPPVQVEAPQMPVVVAARDVKQGSCITEDDVKQVQWPARTPIPGAFSDVAAVTSRGLIAGIVENEPLTDAKLAPAKAGCGLPPSIQPGMRAISVKVNEVIGVAGFVLPGAKVDVLVTIRQNSDSASRIVVSDVQVLTAGTRFDQDQAKDGKPIPTTVVTLMVSPEDAERIALAATEGQILLTLRNPLDPGKPTTFGVRTAGLFLAPTATTGSVPRAPSRGEPRVGRSQQAPPSPPAPPQPPPPPYKVDSIKGGKVTTTEVNR